MTDVKITTEYITLSSFLKWCGAVETGGEAKEAVTGGYVKVDGQVCTMRGKKLYPGATVEIDDNQFRVTA